MIPITAAGCAIHVTTDHRIRCMMIPIISEAVSHELPEPEWGSGYFDVRVECTITVVIIIQCTALITDALLSHIN